jgi:hypothetical protein
MLGVLEKKYLNAGVNQFLTKPGETLIDASLRLGIFDVEGLKVKNRSFNTSPQAPSQPITVDGPPELMDASLKPVIRTMQTLGYVVFKDGSKDYNLNIVGLRSSTTEANHFDDELRVFWRFENRWRQKVYKITTDPGLSWLHSPENKHGTAILKEGQYRGSHQLGKHKGMYDALVQRGPVTVIRDFNRDNKLDFSSGREQTGVFGINIHRANEHQESMFVNKWSAGCQVFARPDEYAEFIRLCKMAVAEWGNSFTYTLIRFDQLMSA